MGLLQRGILHIFGAIDEAQGRYIQVARMLLDASGSPDIEVRITSEGGAAHIGLDIYDLIRTYEGKTTGRVYGHAQSMSAVILQACKERECCKHATLLIHNPYPQNPGWGLLYPQKGDNYGATRKKIKEELFKIRNQLYQILHERTGQPIEEIEKKCLKDTIMTAEEALAFGLIDKIV